MIVLNGLDTGKPLFDNISLHHPSETKGMQLRRLRIACRLGLIEWGTKGRVQVNWQLLVGVVCWVEVSYKNLGARWS